MILKIADFSFKVISTYGSIQLFNKKYFDNHTPCYELKANESDIQYESEMQNKSNIVASGFPKAYLEFLIFQRKIAEWIPLHNALLLHSACLDVDGVGVAFAAHSGTGKTTHMLLWQQLLGERMTVVNGDKPIVRFFDDEPNTPYAYGTPWNGKEHLGCNMRTPLKHLCFIERAAENSVEKLEPSNAINRIFNQVYMPKDPIAVSNTIILIKRLISSCTLWKINCNMDISAAETSYKSIFT